MSIWCERSYEENAMTRDERVQLLYEVINGHPDVRYDYHVSRVAIESGLKALEDALLLPPAEEEKECVCCPDAIRDADDCTCKTIITTKIDDEVFENTYPKTCTNWDCSRCH